MKTRIPGLRSGIALTAMYLGVSAHAATSVSNLTTGRSQYPVGANALATSFTTGSVPATLTSVTVRLQNVDHLTTYAPSICADAAGEPGAALAELPPQPTAPPNGYPFDVTIPSADPLYLAPYTTYWIVLAAPYNNNWYWDMTSSTDEISPYGWTIGDQSHYRSGTWRPMQTGSQTYVGRLAIDAVILPEPSTALAVAAGIAMLSPVRRRRASSTR